MQIAVISRPAALVTVEQAKAMAPVLADDGEALVQALLDFAQAEIEPPGSWVGRAFGEQTLEMTLRDVSHHPEIRVPFPPLRAVSQVVYDDVDGQAQTLDASAYFVMGLGSDAPMLCPVPGRWPVLRARTGTLRIRFQAGYAADDPQLLPAKQALVLAVAQMRPLVGTDLALRSETVEGIGAQTFALSPAADGVMTATIERLLVRYRVWA